MLLEKGVAARLIDKADDSKEVARLVERLREAIAIYQVSEWGRFAGCYSHGRIVITTASDLRPDYRPYCKDLSVCVYYLC